MNHAAKLVLAAVFGVVAVFAARAAESGSDLFGETIGAELRAGNDPREWALAADIVGNDGDFPGDRAELLTKAATAAPHDAFVQWLALSNPYRSGAAPMDSGERARRLAESDPANAAVWLPTLKAAVDARDAVRVDGTLDRMAAAERFDDHFRDYLIAWLDIYARRADRVGESEALVQSMARAAAYALPAYKPVVDACDPAKNAGYPEARRDACERVARVMTAGSTVVTQSIGYAVLRKVDRATPEDREHERTLRWLTRSSGLPEDDARMMEHMRRTIADWRETGNEAEVFRRGIQRQGGALTPPPDWDWREAKR